MVTESLTKWLISGWQFAKTSVVGVKLQSDLFEPFFPFTIELNYSIILPANKQAK